jgi:hypothetical protein
MGNHRHEMIGQSYLTGNNNGNNNSFNTNFHGPVTVFPESSVQSGWFLESELSEFKS